MNSVNRIPKKPERPPVMDDPMGKHWDQPDRMDMCFTDAHVYMSAEVFKKLHEYSCSYPSGVYPGKMWRFDARSYNRNIPEDSPIRHQLRWYGESEDPTKCSNHQRTIVIEG